MEREKMPLVGLALGAVNPLHLTRAWRDLSATSEERLRHATDVLDILFLEVVVRREIEAAVSKTLTLLELDIVCLSTLEEIHGLHMEREEVIPRLDLMLRQELPEVFSLRGSHKSHRRPKVHLSRPSPPRSISCPLAPCDRLRSASAGARLLRGSCQLRHMQEQHPTR